MKGIFFKRSMTQFSKEIFEYFSMKLKERDIDTYYQAIQYLKIVFKKYELQKVKEFAKNYQIKIEKISPLIENVTQRICPSCKEVCCINKHGYYNFEDLIYLYAVGLEFPNYKFGGEDSEACQFLSHNGCSLNRSLRPSGCNWYFCDALLEYIENMPEYFQFDYEIQNLAETWMMMLEEFSNL